MIILIPVSLFRVPYELASGRPYSVLEELVLTEVGAGSRTLDELSETFYVHRRLLIEAIVTLMHAGWIGLDTTAETGANKYTLTRAGQALLGSRSAQKNLLPSAITTRQTEISVVVERVQGQIARNSEVNWFQRTKLEQIWANAVVMKKSFVRNACAPSLLDPILPRHPDEWVRYIGEPFPTRFADDYAVVNVDPVLENIVGLPQSWEPMLKDILLDTAREQTADRSIDETLDDEEIHPYLAAKPGSEGLSSIKSVGHGTAMEDIRFLAGCQEHDDAMLDFIRNVKSYVVIVSASICEKKIAFLKDTLVEAVGRGVVVTFFWSAEQIKKDSKEISKTRTTLHALAREAEGGNVNGRFVFNLQPSGSHACVLFGDWKGFPTAVVGSHPWLARLDVEREPKSVSVIVRQPAIARGVALAINDLLTDDRDLAGSSEPIRMRNVSAELGNSTVATNDSEGSGEIEEQDRNEHIDKEVRVELLLDSQNEKVLHSEMLLANREFQLALPSCESTKLREIDILMSSMQKGSSCFFRVEISQNEIGEDADSALETKNSKQNRKGSVEVVFGFDGSSGYFSRDSEVIVVSSCGWLTEPALRSQSPVADVGIRLKGVGLVEHFRESTNSVVK